MMILNVLDGGLNLFSGKVKQFGNFRWLPVIYKIVVHVVNGNTRACNSPVVENDTLHSHLLMIHHNKTPESANYPSPFILGRFLRLEDWHQTLDHLRRRGDNPSPPDFQES